MREGDISMELCFYLHWHWCLVLDGYGMARHLFYDTRYPHYDMIIGLGKRVN